MPVVLHRQFAPGDTSICGDGRIDIEHEACDDGIVALRPVHTVWTRVRSVRKSVAYGRQRPLR